MSAEEVDAALSSGLTWKSYSSPGVETTVAELARLAQQGLVRQVDEGWVLTKSGLARYQRLEDLFDNSNGYGDYGF